MKSDQIDYLLNHMMWADAEVWKKVLLFESAENDDKIKKLLYHLHQVQYAFYSLWNNMPIELPKAETFVNLKSIAKWGFDYQQKLNGFLISEKIPEKDKLVDIPWSKFAERKFGKKIYPATFEETVMQIVSHSTYHRGQINARLRELGGEPASVDFIVWVWIGKTKADFNFI